MGEGNGKSVPGFSAITDPVGLLCKNIFEQIQKNLEPEYLDPADTPDAPPSPSPEYINVDTDIDVDVDVDIDSDVDVDIDVDVDVDVDAFAVVDVDIDIDVDIDVDVDVDVDTDVDIDTTIDASPSMFQDTFGTLNGILAGVGKQIANEAASALEKDLAWNLYVKLCKNGLCKYLNKKVVTEEKTVLKGLLKKLGVSSTAAALLVDNAYGAMGLWNLAIDPKTSLKKYISAVGTLANTNFKDLGYTPPSIPKIITSPPGSLKLESQILMLSTTLSRKSLDQELTSYWTSDKGFDIKTWSKDQFFNQSSMDALVAKLIGGAQPLYAYKQIYDVLLDNLYFTYDKGKDKTGAGTFGSSATGAVLMPKTVAINALYRTLGKLRGGLQQETTFSNAVSTVVFNDHIYVLELAKDPPSSAAGGDPQGFPTTGTLHRFNPNVQGGTNLFANNYYYGQTSYYSAPPPKGTPSAWGAPLKVAVDIQMDASPKLFVLTNGTGEDAVQYLCLSTSGAQSTVYNVQPTVTSEGLSIDPQVLATSYASGAGWFPTSVVSFKGVIFAARGNGYAGLSMAQRISIATWSKTNGYVWGGAAIVEIPSAQVSANPNASIGALCIGIVNSTPYLIFSVNGLPQPNDVPQSAYPVYGVIDRSGLYAIELNADTPSQVVGSPYWIQGNLQDTAGKTGYYLDNNFPISFFANVGELWTHQGYLYTNGIQGYAGSPIYRTKMSYTNIYEDDTAATPKMGLVLDDQDYTVVGSPSTTGFGVVVYKRYLYMIQLNSDSNLQVTELAPVYGSVVEIGNLDKQSSKVVPPWQASKNFIALGIGKIVGLTAQGEIQVLSLSGGPGQLLETTSLGVKDQTYIGIAYDVAGGNLFGLRADGHTVDRMSAFYPDPDLTFHLDLSAGKAAKLDLYLMSCASGDLYFWAKPGNIALYNTKSEGKVTPTFYIYSLPYNNVSSAPTAYDYNSDYLTPMPVTQENTQNNVAIPDSSIYVAYSSGDAQTASFAAIDPQGENLWLINTAYGGAGYPMQCEVYTYDFDGSLVSEKANLFIQSAAVLRGYLYILRNQELYRSKSTLATFFSTTTQPHPSVGFYPMGSVPFAEGVTGQLIAMNGVLYACGSDGSVFKVHVPTAALPVSNNGSGS